MPVKIIDKNQKGKEDNPINPRVVNKDKLENSMTDFDDNYKAIGGVPLRNVKIKVLWNKLKTFVENFMHQNNLNNDEVAMQFIHCLQNTDQYYTVLRLRKFDPLTGNYAMLSNPTPEAWFQLDANITDGIQALDQNDSIVQGIITKNYCNEAYQNGVYYHQSGVGVNIGQDVELKKSYVRSLIFPWHAEIETLYDQNESVHYNITHVVFCSYTQDLSGQPNRSNIDWPHGMVAYMVKNNTHDMLDDNNYITVFANKAADYASLCPPNCTKYTLPT